MGKVISAFVATAGLLAMAGLYWTWTRSTVAAAPARAGASCDTVCQLPHPPNVRTDYPVTHTDAEWHRLLNASQYAILRQKDTERAFTGALWDNHQDGTYACAGCGNPLFASAAKFESGTGWPSFYQPITARAIDTQSDRALGMVRTEVLCARCGGHLGHVFDDGPRPTGLRYCINSGALTFEKSKQPAGRPDPAASREK